MGDKVVARALSIEETERRRFLERTPRSARLFRTARRSMPLGAVSNLLAGDPYPIYIERASGSHGWDVDDNEFIDFHSGFGSLVVGHAHPRIVEALHEAALNGTQFPGTPAVAVAVSEEICRRFHVDRVRFVNSGGDATMDALRIARAATHRQKYVRMIGSYHGAHDAVLYPRNSTPVGDTSDAPWPASEGIPMCNAEGVLAVQFNDANSLGKLLRQHRRDVAAVLLEPVMMNIGVVLPDAEYLQAVRELCTENDVLLIYDEVKTGATVAYGGAVEAFGVQPDLICLAKAVGGGIAIGFVGGRADLMDRIGKDLAQQGTHFGNPFAATVALTTLRDVLTRSAYSRLTALTERLASGCQRALDEYDVPAHVAAIGCKGGVYYSRRPLRDYRDYSRCLHSIFWASWFWLLNRGVFVPRSPGEQWTVSVQHTDEDIDRYVVEFSRFCEALSSAAA